MDKIKLENTLNSLDWVAICISISFLSIDALLFVLRPDNYQILMLLASVPAVICVIYFVIAYILDVKFLGGE